MLNSILTETITWYSLLICTGASFVLGIIGALIYMYKSTYTKGFILTLALLPSVVQIVIMLVNGNLGTGVAVMGAFGLVRFRSAPGGAREIGSIFLAMALGLATGTGYITVAVIFLAVYALVSILLISAKFGEGSPLEKELKITIPESLDYNGIFDDLFGEYTKKSDLVKVKTTNMGSLYELTYHIVIPDLSREKEFIDKIRCRNGNLNIVCGRVPVGKDEL